MTQININAVIRLFENTASTKDLDYIEDEVPWHVLENLRVYFNKMREYGWPTSAIKSQLRPHRCVNLEVKIPTAPYHNRAGTGPKPVQVEQIVLDVKQGDLLRPIEHTLLGVEHLRPELVKFRIGSRIISTLKVTWPNNPGCLPLYQEV
jgi:hypothetical protein